MIYFFDSVRCETSNRKYLLEFIKRKSEGSVENAGYRLGYISGYSKKTSLSRLLIKLIKSISNLNNKQPKLRKFTWV